MDKKVESILNLLNEKAGANYTVLEKHEILSQLPQKLGIDETEFSTAINFLQEKDFISVKYQDKREICVAVTTRTASYFQYKSSDIEQAELSKRNYLFVFLFGLFGAFIGSFSALLLFKFLGLF